MKAILVPAPGGPEAMQLMDVPVPQPGAGQALVKIAASGVNFIDVYFRTGLYKAEPPVSLGMEAAGIVEAVGDGVAGLKPGDRVAYAMARGSYAEYAVVPAAVLVKVPDGMDLTLAAAAMLQGMTAHYLTHSTFPLKEGQTAVVHAAAGGAGFLTVQMAKLRGARVIATVGSEPKAALARQAGADEVLHYDDLGKVRGVEVVYDSVGQATFLKSLDCLKPRGMMVSFGQSSGPVPAIEPLLLSAKGSLFLTRPSLGNYVATREELEWRAGDVLGWVANGKLKLHLHGNYPLAEAARAHRDLEGRATTGKLLLVP